MAVGSNGRAVGHLTKSSFPFSKHGESGLPISSLYPNLAKHADDLCVVRSMHSDTAAHASGCLQMNTGSVTIGKPSVGSWLSYGLGTLNEDLPSYVVMTDPRGDAVNSPPQPSSHNAVGSGAAFNGRERSLAPHCPSAHDPARIVALLRPRDLRRACSMPTDRGQQVVVLCANEADGDLAPAEFYGPGGRRATGARLSLQSLALRRARAQPHAFYDGGYTWVIDHAHGALHRFPGDHTVLGRDLSGPTGRLVLHDHAGVLREAGGHGGAHRAHAHDADGGGSVGHGISTG
jgi:hypothetical protein